MFVENDPEQRRADGVARTPKSAPDRSEKSESGGLFNRCGLRGHEKRIDHDVLFRVVHERALLRRVRALLGAG